MGRSSYQCCFGDPARGDRHVLSFTVAIGPRTPAVSTGQVRTLEVMKGLDPDASNDSAALTLRLAQGGSAARASGSVSGGPSAGSGPLADTGFGGGWIAWAAGALLLAGGMALALSRRSRGGN